MSLAQLLFLHSKPPWCTFELHLGYWVWLSSSDFLIRDIRLLSLDGASCHVVIPGFGVLGFFIVCVRVSICRSILSLMFSTPLTSFLLSVCKSHGYGFIVSMGHFQSVLLCKNVHMKVSPSSSMITFILLFSNLVSLLIWVSSFTVGLCSCLYWLFPRPQRLLSYSSVSRMVDDPSYYKINQILSFW